MTLDSNMENNMAKAKAVKTVSLGDYHITEFADGTVKMYTGDATFSKTFKPKKVKKPST